MVSNTGLNLLSKIILYKMIAFSVIHFPSQFRAPPESHLAIERKGVFLTIGGPFNAYPMKFLYTLKENSIFPISVPDMKLNSVAARSRIILSTVPHWRQYYDMVQEAKTADDAFLVPAFPAWFSKSVVFALNEADEMLTKCCITWDCFTSVKNIRKGHYQQDTHKVQKEIYTLMMPVVNEFSPARYFETRFRRWFSHEQSSIFASRIMSTCGILYKSVPPCVMHATDRCHTWYRCHTRDDMLQMSYAHDGDGDDDA